MTPASDSWASPARVTSLGRNANLGVGLGDFEAGLLGACTCKNNHLDLQYCPTICRVISVAPVFSCEYIPGNSCAYIVGSMTERAPSFSPKSTDHLPDITTAEQRSLSKWYTVARAALARNRPLTADSPTDSRSTATDLSAAETEALRSVGALKDKTSLRAENDPLIKSQAQYMALLEDSLSAADAAKILRVDVSRVRQRLRERSLFGIEYEGNWRLPRFQFERRLVIPGLAQVLKSLPPDLFPLDVVDWFVLSDPDLQMDSDAAPLSPRDWLLSGRPIEAVITLARDFTRA
jgi:hypothetical protein